jgi:hypothetical protein
MKKLFIASLLFLFVISFANAQDQPKADTNRLVASVGLMGAMPMSDFKDVYKLGIGGTMDASYLFTKNIAGRLEISIVDFMFDKDKYYTRTNTSSNTITLTGGGDLIIATKLSFCAGLLKPAQNQKFSIYGLLSVGAYLNLVSDISAKTSAGVENITPGSNNVFMGVGAGVRFAYKISSRAHFFLEGGYETFFPAERWGKATFGTRDDFIPVKLGVMITPF